jgi:hypothetical protein
VINIRERNVGADMLIFDSNNVFFSAIFGIPCHLARPQFPAEAGTPEQVEHGLIFHHLGWCHQDVHDNARFSPIHDRVASDSPNAIHLCEHDGGIGVGGTYPQVSCAGSCEESRCDFALLMLFLGECDRKWYRDARLLLLQQFTGYRFFWTRCRLRLLCGFFGFLRKQVSQMRFDGKTWRE